MQKEVFKKICGILDEYCDGCFLKQHLRQQSTRTDAHRFCIRQCTVGRQLQEMGKTLTVPDQKGRL